MDVNETLRDGRYVITRTLGEGAQASTFEAVDKRDGRLVAIKRFEVRTAKRWKDVELAEREANVLATMSHPQLPAYVEHFEEGGALILVMERMEGVSLTDFKKRGATFRQADVIRFLEQSAAILSYLHGRTPPVVHRDLKPGNVMRRPDGTFAFVDFGAVRDRLRPAGGSTVVGTFGYMAPEQFQGRATPGSDVYAIGATALWMLTGTEPEDLPHKGLGIDVSAALGPRVNPELVTVLKAMLEPDPEKRPRSIAPLLAGFDLRGRTVRPGVSSESHEGPRPRSSAPLAPPPAPDPALDVSSRTLRWLRRALPLLWVFCGLSWWSAPSATALSFTIGLVVLTLASRAYGPKHDDRFERKRVRQYDRQPAIHVRVKGEVDEIPSGQQALEANRASHASKR